jgi:hypothetical protein
MDYREPWVKIERCADNFVNELRREVVRGHALWNKDVRAIAQRTDSDDVLLEVEGVPLTYAVVHLTWSGEQETNSLFPYTKLFYSLDQWVRECMIPDNQECIR